MSTHVAFQGPFIKAFYSNTLGAGTRQAGNPALPAVYSDTVPSPLRRVNLFIQNKGATEIDLTLSGQASTLKLYAGQSVSFDNYNGGFLLSSYASVTVLESFA